MLKVAEKCPRDFTGERGRKFIIFIEHEILGEGKEVDEDIETQKMEWNFELKRNERKVVEIEKIQLQNRHLILLYFIFMCQYFHGLD